MGRTPDEHNPGLQVPRIEVPLCFYMQGVKSADLWGHSYGTEYTWASQNAHLFGETSPPLLCELGLACCVIFGNAHFPECSLAPF